MSDKTASVKDMAQNVVKALDREGFQTLSDSDVLGVIRAYNREIHNQLATNRRVQIPNVATFTVTKQKSATTLADTKYRNCMNARMSKGLRRALKHQEIREERGIIAGTSQGS